MSSSSHFAAQTVFELHKAGNVTAGPRQAIDKAGTDRIGDTHEHDRHGASCLQQRSHGRSATGHDDVRRERGQFHRVFANGVGIGCGPAGVDPHVAAVDPAQLLQPLQERRVAGLRVWIVRADAAREYTDAPHPLDLLRARCERPRGRRAAEKANELTSPHIRTQAQGPALYRLKRVL